MSAIKAQTALLSVETARASAKAITGLTAANPGVVTAVANGYSNGNIIYVSAVAGMVQVNGRAFVVFAAATDAWSMKGVDTSAYTAYSSGGNGYKCTMTAVGQVANVDGFDGQASEIDVTHLQSVSKEYLLGLQDFGNLSLELLLDNSDTGQAKLRALKESAAAAVYTLYLSDGTTAAFVAYVKSFTVSAPKDGAVTCKCVLRITGTPSWFA